MLSSNVTHLTHLKGVLLDWAGTTIDFGCFAPVAASIRLFEQFGIKISEQDARKPMGLNKRDHIIAILSEPHIKEAWVKEYNKPWKEDDVDTLYHSFLPLQCEVILEYGSLLPDTLDAMECFRKMGLKIGSNTGYNDTIMQSLALHARHQGFVPDVTITGSQVREGRPKPWMAFKAAEALDIFPMSRMVKIGDTVPDIHEGLNAGMWTISVVHSSSEMGLSLEQFKQLDASELKAREAAITEKFKSAGSHYVVNTLSDVPEVLQQIDHLLAEGQLPSHQ